LNQTIEQFLGGHPMWIPITLFFGFLLFALSISWTQLAGAPWVPSSLKVVNKMLSLAEVSPNDLVYDLGCGDGRLVVAAAIRFGARAVGIEVDPFRFIWCQILITILGLRKRVKIIYGNFFKKSFANADVVTCYLLPETNTKLEEKFKQELRSGTRIVSNSFIFPGLQYVRQDGDAKLYLYYPEIENEEEN
jgi:predicted RNA methylase